MKVKDAQMARALDALDPGVRLFLLYGPDEAGSRALAGRLDRAMGPDGERIDLDGATLKDDPARLADEAASISMFGDRRYIRVVGGDECAASITALLELETDANPVVMIAGALKPASALLKATLDHPATLACISYKPEGASAEALAVTIGRGVGLRLGPGVARRLADNCLGDRGVLEREIEKIALCLDAAPDRPRDASEEALDAIGADLGESDTGKLVNAVMAGDVAATARALLEIEADNAWVPALRALQRRIVLLARMRSEVDAGKSSGAVVGAMGKSLFWKDKDAVSRDLGRWPSAKLATASARVFAAEGAMMARGTAGHVLAGEELITIARVAERLR